MGNKPNNGDTVRVTKHDGTIIEGRVSTASEWGFWIGGIIYQSYKYSSNMNDTYEIVKRALPPEPSCGSVVAFGNFATQRFAHGWVVMAAGSRSYSWEGLNDYMQSCGVVAQPVILREGWAV